MELHQIQQTHSPTPFSAPDRAREAAREFEALFVSMLVKAMRKTVPDNPLTPRSFGEKIYTEMLDNEYADQLADNGTLGLADLIYREISNNDETAASLSGLGQPAWLMDNRFLPRTSRPDLTGTLQERLEKYETHIKAAAGEYAVEPALIRAVIAQESSANPYAVSRAGAKGLMQLIDSTARQMGVGNVFDPAQNIHGGTRYLREMLDRFDGDEQLALAAYNAGPSAVEKYGGIPPYRETRDYITRVRSFKEGLAQPLAGRSESIATQEKE